MSELSGAEAFEAARKIVRYDRHPDDHWVDEIRIVTVPRWKESELSGDEWRFSYKVQLIRKDRPWAERSFGEMRYAATVAAAALYLSAFELKDAGWNVLYEDDDRPLCANPACCAVATVEYRLKQHWRNTAPSEPFSDERRRFCERHKHRGDCGLEDADANYELVEERDPDAR